MKRDQDRSPTEKSLLKIRVIGRQCEIKYAGKIFSGKIENETRNTWKIRTIHGLKMIPKDHAKLQITFNNHKYEINGNQMKGRHEDRIKRRRKRQW